MSGKQAKKIRRIYNKDFKHRMDETLQSIQEQMRHIHRPAPRFFRESDLGRALEAYQQMVDKGLANLRLKEEQKKQKKCN